MNTYIPDYERPYGYSRYEKESAEKIVDLLEIMSEHGCDTPDNIDLALEKLINILRVKEGEEHILCNDVDIVISKKEDEVEIELNPSL